MAVIGAGSWGTAVANLLANKGYTVHLWARDKAVVDAIHETRHHPKYLKDIDIHENIAPTVDLEEAIQPAHVVVMATPSHAMRDIAAEAKGLILGNKKVVSLAKGVEQNSLKRMSQVLEEMLAPEMHNKIAVLSGPNHAEEVSKNIPSATVVSSRSKSVAEELQNVFMTPFFRVYTNPDLIGVELGGATKNVIAIAAGISDGLGYGDNTKASLITRGLAEMIRLGLIMGADVRTFAGLAGMGDLVVTCMSKHSRNRGVGEMLGKGMTLDQAVAEMSMVAEGVKTAGAIRDIAKGHNVYMPITELVTEVLHEDKNPFACVSELMMRGAVEEIRGLSWETD
ncbi:MAG: NAD(P)H-dependent glycerol-3-phosphate dehydrogenase [Candidatus Aquicultor sp.]